MCIGGKTGPGSGTPLDLDVEVTGLCGEVSQTWAGTHMSLGRACALRAGNVQIMVSSIRDQAYGPDLFAAAGIDWAASWIIVGKSAQHFGPSCFGVGGTNLPASGGGPLRKEFPNTPHLQIH